MKQLEAPRTIIDNPDSVFGYFAWPSVVRLADGTLAACSGFRLRHLCPFGKAVISYSRDDGKSWTRPAPVIDTPLDDRDAGLCADGDRVIFTSFNNPPGDQLRWAGDSVRGGDFGANVKLMLACVEAVPADACDKYLGATYRISHDGGYTFGDLKKSPVTGPHGPFRADDGRIIWVGRTFAESGVPDGDRIACAVLDDEENFKLISRVPACRDAYGDMTPYEPHALQLPNGRILVAIRVERGGEHPLFSVCLSHSDDGGRSFSVPRLILPPLAGSPPHLYLTSKGALVLSYACRHGNRGIRARVSYDGGETFGEEILLTENAPSPDLGYPATVERLDGSLLTVWYEREEKFAVIKQMIWTL